MEPVEPYNRLALEAACAANPLQAAGKIIELEGKLPRWRKVADELPAGVTRVLAWWPDPHTEYGGTAVVGYHEKYGFSAAHFIPEPTHWMPLPEPPK